eukprot:g3297.t1
MRRNPRGLRMMWFQQKRLKKELLLEMYAANIGRGRGEDHEKRLLSTISSDDRFATGIDRFDRFAEPLRSKGHLYPVEMS